MQIVMNCRIRSIFVDALFGFICTDMLHRGTSCLLTVAQWNSSTLSWQLVIRCRSRRQRLIMIYSHSV